MSDFAQSLNKDTVNTLFTSARYDTPASKWVQDVALPAVGATLQTAATANGNGTDFTVDGYGVCMLQVTGTFSATITFYGSIDGTNFVPISATDTNAGTIGTTATAAGIFRINCAGYQKVRAVISGYASGTITVTGRALAVAGTQSSMLLSGSNTVVRISRGIYKINQPTNFEVPYGATGMMVSAIIHGATGTFAAGEGLKLLTEIMAKDFNAQNTIFSLASAAYTTAQRNITQWLSPNAITLDQTKKSARTLEMVHAQIPLGGRVQIVLVITGTFAEGEGFDVEVITKWLY